MQKSRSGRRSHLLRVLATAKRDIEKARRRRDQEALMSAMADAYSAERELSDQVRENGMVMAW